MSSASPAVGLKNPPHYFVPAPSRHPAMAALGLLFVMLGAAYWINGAAWGPYSLALGMVIWLGTLFLWFSEAVRESEGGLYGYKIDLSFRWSMSWFIFSEVMFFGAFSRRCGGRVCIQCLNSAAWKTRCCGLTSKRLGRLPAWAKLHRLQILLSRFKPLGLSGCPPSTPRCC